MDKVMIAAQNLANEIVNSEVYQAMNAANNALDEDVAATALMNAFNEGREELQRMMYEEDADQAVINSKQSALVELQKSLQALPTVQAAREAGLAFDQLMNKVNGMMQLIITGEEPNSGCGGCGGSCSSCGGGCGGC